MIETTARLTQGVYLAGETVEVAITLRNPSPPPDAKSQWNDQEEVLAWASAQIHCHCWVNQSRVNVPSAQQPLSAEEQAVTNTRTSFAPCRVDPEGPYEGSGPSSSGSGGGTVGVTGRVVTSTKPTILFCDLRLLPGESKTFWYKEVLPVEGPPSFRGQAVKYAYKLTVGTQRVNSAIKLMRVPIRVLVLQEFTDSAIINGSEDLTPSNPFLSDKEKETPLDSALQVLQVVTSQRNQKFYNITNARGHVVRFCIFKQAYKLGEDIVGSLDFSESNVPCIQYAVTLQSVEEISPECRKHENQRPSINSFSKFHEMCVGFQQSHFVLPVPLHVTPSFYTDLVTLKWRLHFEFVTSMQDSKTSGLKLSEPPGHDDLDGKIWQAPNNVDIETMVWDLSIKLYPNLPSYLSQGLQMQTQFHMRINNSNTT
ncbi:unnamed protein product [Orchesella dallaii]|uniref:RAB6A-GEF complex partner protein 2 n=1 Tax=Orchesella dallaii TaxID=48710 RepID=A0ABP1Q2C7_9HEXA